ncbi:hypothetical protein LCGC14_0757020 [marine sediment metagenome]|uniref:Uncharacterized protein n=1 Tax=marine sediment metagenome TaxID=412755 RepID=A0A0F9QM56_9ZZZZ|nr:hypothetical protein [archaeon]
MKEKTLGFLTYCIILLFIPYASASTWSVSDTFYLNMGESNYIRLELIAGDKVHWSFRTYSDPFEVEMHGEQLGVFSQGEI